MAGTSAPPESPPRSSPASPSRCATPKGARASSTACSSVMRLSSPLSLGAQARLQPVARAPLDLGGHSNDELAEVASLQHSDESAWRVFETVDDVLAVANATRGDARTNLAQEVGIVFGGEVVVDEAAYGQPLRENLPHGRGEPIRTVARWDAVVLRNEPGDRKSTRIVEQRQHGFPDGSADVLEVDVDALWTGRGQSRRKIGGAMINH